MWVARHSGRHARDRAGPGFRARGPAGRGRAGGDRRRTRRPLTRPHVGQRAIDVMMALIDYAISHARLTIATLIVPAAGGLRRLCDDPEGGRAGRQDPDHLRAAHPARHQPGGFRAAAAAAGRDPAQVGRQRQGNALDRLRGRRLCAARVRGRLRFQVGARRRARQGRPGQARPAARRRRADRAGGQSLALSGAGGGAVRRRAGAHACCASRATPRTRSSRCRACSRPNCAARATRRSRSSPSRCC